jgi:hypothetical protein
MFSNPMGKPFKRLETEDDFTETNLSSSGINWLLHQDSRGRARSGQSSFMGSNLSYSGINWVLHQDSEFKDDWELRYPPEDPANYLTASHQIEFTLPEQGSGKNSFPIIPERSQYDPAEHDPSKHDPSEHDPSEHDPSKHDPSDHDSSEHDFSENDNDNE